MSLVEAINIGEFVVWSSLNYSDEQLHVGPIASVVRGDNGDFYYEMQREKSFRVPFDQIPEPICDKETVRASSLYFEAPELDRIIKKNIINYLSLKEKYC